MLSSEVEIAHDHTRTKHTRCWLTRETHTPQEWLTARCVTLSGLKYFNGDDLGMEILTLISSPSIWMPLSGRFILLWLSFNILFIYNTTFPLLTTIVRCTVCTVGDTARYSSSCSNIQYLHSTVATILYCGFKYIYSPSCQIGARYWYWYGQQEDDSQGDCC